MAASLAAPTPAASGDADKNTVAAECVCKHLHERANPSAAAGHMDATVAFRIMSPVNLGRLKGDSVQDRWRGRICCGRVSSPGTHPASGTSCRHAGPSQVGHEEHRFVRGETDSFVENVEALPITQQVDEPLGAYGAAVDSAEAEPAGTEGGGVLLQRACRAERIDWRDDMGSRAEAHDEVVGGRSVGPNRNSAISEAPAATGRPGRKPGRLRSGATDGAREPRLNRAVGAIVSWADRVLLGGGRPSCRSAGRRQVSPDASLGSVIHSPVRRPRT